MRKSKVLLGKKNIFFLGGGGDGNGEVKREMRVGWDVIRCEGEECFKGIKMKMRKKKQREARQEACAPIWA